MVVGKAGGGGGGREATAYKAFGIIIPPYFNKRAHKKSILADIFSFIYLLIYCFVLFSGEKNTYQKDLWRSADVINRKEKLLQLELVNICISTKCSARRNSPDILRYVSQGFW